MKTKISNLDAEESYPTRPTFTFFAAICGRFNREPPPPSFRSILLPLCSFLPPPLDTSTLQDVGTEIRRFLSLSPFFFLVSFSLQRAVQLSRTIARYYPFLVFRS